MTNTFEIEQKSVGMDTLSNIFGTGNDSVLMPKEIADTELEETASRVLKHETLENILDTSLDTVKEAKVKAKEAVTEVEPEITTGKQPVNELKGKETLDSVIAEINKPESETEVPEVSTAGRPKSDKSALVTYLNKKIESNDFGLPDNIEYDATKQSLSDVLGKLPEEQLHSILDSNWKAKEDEIRAQTPQEFFESLPEELQYAADYVARGGEDLKGLFRALSHVEEVRALDPNNEEHQPIIVQNYLQATGWKQEQISEQIEEWKENGKLGKKSNEFKPALDDMQKEQVQAQIRVAEEQRLQQQKLAEFYSTNVYQQLEKNELAGVKLDKKFARQMGDNMTSTVPGPFSGKPVNWLGYGLEMAQYVKPDYEAVMIASWILNDKASALAALGQRGANAKVEETVKLIKQNQGLGKVGGGEQVPIQTKQIKRINSSNVLKKTTMA